MMNYRAEIHYDQFLSVYKLILLKMNLFMNLTKSGPSFFRIEPEAVSECISNVHP